MKILKTIRNFFFPVRCPYCHQVINQKELACHSCKRKFPEKYIDGYAYGGYTCVSSFPYEDIFKKAIISMKFHSNPSYGEKMADVMARDIGKYYRNYSFDYITSVPLHKKKLRKRGYNQSQLLGKHISNYLNIPYIEALVKIKDNKIQHSLSGKARMKNVKNAYKVIDKRIVKDKNILIIDDIITTGCTLGECCRVLFKDGANHISCATFCRTI